MDDINPVIPVSQRKKIENIESFCNSCGHDISVITQFITVNHNELTENEASIIDVLWGSITGLQSGSAKYSQIEAIKIVGCVLSIPKLVFTMTEVMRKVVVLVIHFLKIIFRITDLKVIFDPKCSEKSINVHELSGLAEKMERMEVCIDAVDVAEDVDEPALHSLVSNFDMHIGVDQIGILKSRIQSMMSEGDMKVCLHLLTLFVRISTVRHSLLFRMITCLKTNNYGKHTSETLQKYIEKERVDGEQFLRFFSGPSLRNVGVLSVFEPTEQIELAAYLEDMHIPLKDLRKVLDGRVFLIQPFTNSSILLGRPFPSISAARAMKSSTDVDNIRIRFQFKAIDGSLNLFHICSPDLDEYLYMQNGRYCIYSKNFKERTGAQWRIIQVREEDERDDMPSLFVLCTKKTPQQFLYMEKSFFECARGLEEIKPPTKECLFKLIPPGESPIHIPISNRGILKSYRLPEEKMDVPHTLQVSSRTKIENIHSFCKSFGYGTNDVIQNSIANISELTAEDIRLIDALWNSRDGFQKKSGKCSIIDAIRVLGSVLSANINFPRAGLTTKVIFLVVYFFKIMFCIVDLKELLDPKYTLKNFTFHEFSGLAENISKTDILIDAVEIKENVHEPSLHRLISNFDTHIGVDQIRNMKSCITSMMCEGGDMQTCLHLLTLFVRLSILRHALLFRLKTCLEANNYSPGTSGTLKHLLIKKEQIAKSF